MKATSGRTFLSLALLGLVLAGSLWTGLTAWQNGVWARVPTMQLQGSPDGDEVLISLGTGPGDKTVCMSPEVRCSWPTQDLARVPAAERASHDRKVATAPSPDVQPKQD